MSTRTLVNDVKRLAQKWSKANILALLNEGQRIMFAKDAFQHRYIDPATGFPPYLATTANLLEYDIPDVTVDIGGTDYTCRIKRLKKIFVDVTNYKDYDRRWMGEPFQYMRYNPYTPATSKLAFSEVKGHSYEATAVNRARYIFPEDPTTSTEKWYAEGLLEPPELTTVNIPLMIPEGDAERALKEYALGQIEWFDLGNSQRLEAFDAYWLPRYLDDMNDGSQVESPFTPGREA